MTQETVVVKLSPRVAPAMQAELARANFEFRSVPHALFSAKGAGVVATFYASGKLVVQGDGAQLFVARYAGGAASAASATSGANATGSANTDADDPSTQGPLVGSDECGKGDYFGPLVACAVRLTPEESAQLRTGGVRDSKTLSDDACIRLGGALRSRFAHAIARLDPPEYNATYARVKNVNAVLADLHAQAIRELAEPGDRVLVDKFADEKLLRERLRGVDIELLQRVRAEAITAVAAASIIAREEFLTALHALSEDVAVDLHKGAGEPVDVAGRRFVALHGRAELARVAKLHFKNTQRVAGA